jgi:hypothetical protein
MCRCSTDTLSGEPEGGFHVRLLVDRRFPNINRGRTLTGRFNSWLLAILSSLHVRDASPRHLDDPVEKTRRTPQVELTLAQA